MYLLVHLLSGAEIQLWMHKRLWLEGKGKHDGIYKMSYSIVIFLMPDFTKHEKCCFFFFYIQKTFQFHLIFSTYLLRFFYSTGVKIHCGNKMFFLRLERAKKLQEQKEKELFEKQQQQQQEIAAGKSR